MKHRLLHNPTILQVLHDDAIEQSRRDRGVPHAFRVDHDDGATGANTQTWRFAALDAADAMNGSAIEMFGA